MHRSLCVVALLASLLAGCCCPAINAARDAAQRTQSMNNMKQLAIAAINYREINGNWPESMNELGTQVPDLGMLLANPVTMDNPGYEYVKPTDEEAAMSETVILYQLRNGSRDMTLPVGYADGSVR